MAKTGDIAVATEVEVITKELATNVYPRNTHVSAFLSQYSVSSVITYKVVAAHSTIIITLYFTLLWIKEGQ